MSNSKSFKLSAHHKNRTQDVGIRERSQRNKIKTVRYQDTPIDKATKMKLTKWNSREVNTLVSRCVLMLRLFYNLFSIEN